MEVFSVAFVIAQDVLVVGHGGAEHVVRTVWALRRATVLEGFVTQSDAEPNHRQCW